ncbi:MAG: T9SS type A sorting domain-containing protein [Saprospiraceae bacterium]|jgi:hypothetical protein|uniref:T9SS type A sorting domain-containing protein n=1 Tax=Candidatus Brachybacter algidus TaxID=2982024 RepID=UPI001B66FB3D|nr:T9SS type A sorting domain-containing protein [Candidatus Brachybacter algidus]MBP7305552.1 T9SS type A sorting domain-containing protein [Saprospiraceae bacterium]MBK6450691.1 T9SS type A sorting domain-containing protein [Candidatus Brachybacter algidus]MBK8356316.1 T9SS type A sorting domain-containing protein [Candidatus Brachybacter algidus]MBK8842692.1 T9SS type A sorting domain-containing protein [Candidatus Brachybacter algidus]MBK9022468.1 T9SS type A sorting domain-containing prot
MKFLQRKGKAIDRFMVFDLVWVALMGVLFIQNTFSELPQSKKQQEELPVISISATAQAAALNCLAGVNISISQSGTSQITPGYFVTPTYINFASLQLSIVGRPAPIIDCDDVGHFLTAVIYDPIADQTCSTQFFVEDKMPPTFECATKELPCGIEIYSIQPPYTELVTVTDNCTNPPTVTILSHTEKNYTCPSPYTFEIVRTYKATDASGNSATCQDTVRFLRPVLDEIVFPNDTTMSCSEFSQDTSVTGEPTWMGYPLRGVCYTWFGKVDKTIPMGCPGRFKIRRIWTVMDECNNTPSARDTQFIMSIDTTAPIIFCPADTTIGLTQDLCVANYSFPAVIATDNCSNNVTFSFRVDGLLVFNTSTSLLIGEHIIEVRANDGCNNSSTCTYNVTVEDQQAPYLTCHNINVGLGNTETGIVCADSLGFDYSDNCAGPLTISIKKSTDNSYTNCVTYTCDEVGQVNTLDFKVCDQYGNCTTCSFTVTVQDKEFPQINCGADVDIELTCFQTDTLNPENYLPTATDNCGDPVITWLVNSVLDCNNEGTIDIVYTATDAGGNSASCTKTFNVTNPNALDEGDIIWPADLDMAGCNPNINDTSVTGYPILLGEFCNEIDIFSANVDTTINGDGCAVYVKQYTVIDSCIFLLSGGTDGKFVHLQNITVTGATAPNLIVPPNVTIEPTNINNCTAQVDLALATATGCGQPIVITNSFNNGGANADGIYPFGVTLVTFTATNSCGLTTIGVTTVTVEYESNDLLICPPGFDVSCMMEFNPNNLPAPTIMNVCGTYDLDTLITGNVSVCGNSILTVTYSILTNDGRTDQCSFNINVMGTTPLTEANIEWPDSPITIECSGSIDPDSLGSFPVINVGDGCTMSSVSYTDTPSDPLDIDACSAIDRLWTVIDSCNYVPNTQNGVFTFLQHIDIIDNMGPQITNYNDGDTILSPLTLDDCKKMVDLSNLIISDCSPLAIATNDYPGAIDNNSLDASGFFTLGTVKINYYVEDICGNGNNFSLYVQVVDSFPPTWPCPDSLDVFINESGLDTVYASDFSYIPYEAFDNCNYFDIYFTFDSLDLSDSIIYLVCTGSPQDLSIPDVKVWVFDKSGLSTSCIVDLNVLVPVGQNTNCNNLMGIVGNLADEGGRPLVDVEIIADGDKHYLTKSGASGDYEIYDVIPGADLQVNARKSGPALKGVNTADAIAIRDHILGRKSLDSPYKLLSADVNADNAVSVRDLIEIRKLILGKTDKFSSDESWRFADKGYHFPNKKNPFNQPKVFERTLQNVLGMKPIVNFVALKLGDVNNSAMDEIASGELDTRNQPVIIYTSLAESKDDYVKVKLSSDQLKDLRGFQFELNFDNSALEFVSFENGNLEGFTDENYNVDQNNPGTMAFSWDDELGRSGKEIGVITFKKLNKGNLMDDISITEGRIQAEAYDVKGITKNIVMLAVGSWESDKSASGKLLQNSPNPFSNKTNINVLLTESTQGKLTIFDATGRTVFVKKGMFEKGLNTIEVKSTDINGSGIYIYKFESDVFTDTKKMILTL